VAVRLAPGEVAAFHTHLLDYTTVTVDGDVVERLNADGTTDRLQVSPGMVMRWHQSTQRHGLRNSGSRPFHNVIVEIKSLPADFPTSAVG
jgi:hypothetical protein